jgi:hypothetical protein
MLGAVARIAEHLGDGCDDVRIRRRLARLEIALIWIGMIAFLGVLIWAAYALISNATRRPGSRDDGGDPFRILPPCRAPRPPS